MKKTLKVMMGLVTVLLSFAASSCSKDEMNEKNLEGKWQITSVDFKEYKEGKLVEEFKDGQDTWVEDLVFKSDGTGQMVSRKGIFPITWVVMEEKLMITVSYGGDPDTTIFDIVEIKGKSMIISETLEEYMDVQYKWVYTYNFEKI